MMRTLLFDDSGEIWDANSRSLAEALQASLSSDELAKYVVRNLGFISAAESVGSVRLRLRPAIVSPTALSALCYWLHDQTIERVLISFLDGEWTHELVRTCEEAVRALLARVKFSAADREGDFLHLSKPLHDLPGTSHCTPCSRPGRSRAANSTASGCSRFWIRPSTVASCCSRT